MAARSATDMPVTARLYPGQGGIDAAASYLRAGELVAMPTETVYGLAADATNDLAVARIFAAKGRPHFNPLIVHVHDLAAAEALCHFNDAALALARRFWPGPLTLVLPQRQPAKVSALCTAGLPTMAVRVPGSPVARALLKAVDRPLAAPSANPSGRLSPTSADHVLAGLEGVIAAVLDGGPCEVGLESTILACGSDGLVMLRAGGLPRREIEAAAGVLLTEAQDDPAKPLSPGRLLVHYAPVKPLRLNVSGVNADEGLLAFGPSIFAGAKITLNLSPAGDLVEAASHLFAMLRDLDASNVSGIAVMPIPQDGLGEAINDRLGRAAHD